MRNWTITKQIRTVTFALMAALALVSLVAIGSIIRLGQIFSDYQTSARVSQLSLDLSEQLFKAEIAEL